VGAANDSERDAQQAQMPIMMVLIVASMCFPIISGPPRPARRGADDHPVLLARADAMRVLLTPVPAWQLALSFVSLLGTIALALWAPRGSSVSAS